MLVEIVAGDADPAHGGFPMRVHAILQMLAQFARVRCILTTQSSHREIPGVEYEFQPIRETAIDKAGRLLSYYSTRSPGRRPSEIPDVIFVESLDLFRFARDLPDIPVVLDEHNIYWNQLPYEITNSGMFKTPFGQWPVLRGALVPWLLLRARDFETRAIRSAEAVLVTSERDRQVILSRMNDVASKVAVLPNCIDVRAWSSVGEEAPTPVVLFVGSFDYVPNRDAAQIIADVIAPKIPEAEFVLIGDDPPSLANRPPNVTITGHLPDIAPALGRAWVCIAPLVRGSGTRIKVLTYLAAGKAVVSTTKGCEGLRLENERHLLIRDDLADFTDSLRELLQDPSLRHRLGAAGQAQMEALYDWRAHAAGLKQIVTRVATPQPERAVVA